MNEQMYKLNRLDQLLSDTRTLPMSEKYGAYAAAKTLVRELKEYASEHDIGGYTLEKLGALDWHVGVIFGFDADSGLPIDQHYVGCLRSIEILKSDDGFGKWAP